MAEDKTDSIKFHHIKSNFFRVIRADGAIGGITPSGEIFFNLYSQRPPIPKITVQAIEDGHLSGEIVKERKTKDGIVRELEIGVSLNTTTARALIQWLQEKVNIIDTLQGTDAQQSERIAADNESKDK